MHLRIFAVGALYALFTFYFLLKEMNYLDLILISIGLAMDCFAVSIASSIAYGRYDWPKILRMALFFGFFQGAMPFIGWFAGVWFADFIGKIDHWLAFVILGFLGGKMIVGSLKKDAPADEKKSPFGSMRMLLVMAVATSIDALATGLIFVPLGNFIYQAVAVIALGSFIFTILGCIIGVSFGKRFKLNVELIGGLILFGIGLKILLEHLISGC